MRLPRSGDITRKIRRGGRLCTQMPVAVSNVLRSSRRCSLKLPKHSLRYCFVEKCPQITDSKTVIGLHSTNNFPTRVPHPNRLISQAPNISRISRFCVVYVESRIGI